MKHATGDSLLSPNVRQLADRQYRSGMWDNFLVDAIVSNDFDRETDLTFLRLSFLVCTS